MGKRAVQVSGALWQEMCTTGWRVGAPSQDGLECIEGLPEGAAFHSAFYNPSPCLGTHLLMLIFEHPNWPALIPGEEIPTVEIVWRQSTWDDCIGP